MSEAMIQESPQVSIQLRRISTLGGQNNDSYDPIVIVGPLKFFEDFPWCLKKWGGVHTDAGADSCRAKLLVEAASQHPEVVLFGPDCLVQKGVAAGPVFEIPDSSGQTHMARIPTN